MEEAQILLAFSLIFCLLSSTRDLSVQILLHQYIYLCR